MAVAATLAHDQVPGKGPVIGSKSTRSSLAVCGPLGGGEAVPPSMMKKGRAALLAWLAPPGATGRADERFRERIAGDALGEAAVQARVHRDDVDGCSADGWAR